MAGGRSRRKKKQAEKAGKRKARERRAAALAHHELSGNVVGSKCLLPLRVCHPSNPTGINQEIVSLIDTGATASTIRSDIAANLNLPTISQARVELAQGSVVANVVAAVLALEVTGTDEVFTKLRPLVVMDEAETKEEMLFGMDALEGGELVVDMVRHQWRWKLKSIGGPVPGQ